LPKGGYCTKFPIAIRFSECARSSSAYVITFLSLYGKRSVTLELIENIPGWERIKSALDEIRVCHEGSLTFFSGVFDQLDSHRWDLLHKEFDEDRTELRDARQSFQGHIEQIASMIADLSTARNEFQNMRGELARHSEALMAASSQSRTVSQEAKAGIINKISDVEQQQSLLDTKREALAEELECVRSLAETMAALLAEQKRSSDTGQNQWSEELRQMRSMLESLTGQIDEGKVPVESSPAVKPESGVGAVALTDPVLESVLAQFEVLQQDRFSRRLEKAQCKNNS
jgi:hypothetical protein